MDAYDQVRSEGISLQTTVMAQQSEIAKLQAADHMRQTVISDLLKVDHRRQRQLVEDTKIVKSLDKPKSKNAKVRVNTEESAVKPEPELKNTIGCNLNPSDGPGKPNSIIMKTVKTKWALNQFQQPICVQLTKTVKTLKAQS
ncbi:hypothetical protein Tco_1457374 [Tanacetum coccineum]